MKNLGSHQQRLFKEDVRKTKKKDKEWFTVWEKGFGGRLHMGKVLVPHASVMKMITFNWVC